MCFLNSKISRLLYCQKGPLFEVEIRTHLRRVVRTCRVQVFSDTVSFFPKAYAQLSRLHDTLLMLRYINNNRR